MMRVRQPARLRSDEDLAKAICRLLVAGRDPSLVTRGRGAQTERAMQLAEQNGWLKNGELTAAGREMTVRSRAGSHRSRTGFLN